MQRKRALAGSAAVLAVLGLPARAFATLDGSNSGSTATARFTGEFVGPTVTSVADEVSVTLFNSANEAYTPPFGPWLDDFLYESTIVGSGTVSYGSAAGEIETEASAVPEFVEAAPGNPSTPVYNSDASTVDATLHLDFQEDGVVTGSAPGTPVTLTVNFVLQATATMVGGHPSFDRDTIAQFSGRIIDQAVGFGSVERTVYGNGLTSVNLETAVGHELSIEGHLYLFVDGLAGASQGASGYFPQYLGSVDATLAGLWMTAPGGIGIDAPSGHDYTLALPEPGRLLLFLVGAGMLLLDRVWLWAGPRPPRASRQ
jgi:hypothetical protein